MRRDLACEHTEAQAYKVCKFLKTLGFGSQKKNSLVFSKLTDALIFRDLFDHCVLRVQSWTCVIFSLHAKTF